MSKIYTLQHTVGSYLLDLYTFDNIHDAIVYSIILTSCRDTRMNKIMEFKDKFAKGKVNESNMNDFGNHKSKYWFADWYSDLGYTDIQVSILNEHSADLNKWRDEFGSFITFLTQKTSEDVKSLL